VASQPLGCPVLTRSTRDLILQRRVLRNSAPTLGIARCCVHDRSLLPTDLLPCEETITPFEANTALSPPDFIHWFARWRNPTKQSMTRETGRR
jgi:hypothetical protein